MINQKENKKVRMRSWFFKLLSRDMKTTTTNKDQPINSQKNNRKKNNGNYNTYHRPLFQKWIDRR